VNQRFPQPRSNSTRPPVQWRKAGLAHYVIHAFSDYTAEYLKQHNIKDAPFLSKVSVCGGINLHSQHAGQPLGDLEPAEGEVCKRCQRLVVKR
jgi:hypothetical protein